MILARILFIFSVSTKYVFSDDSSFILHNVNLTNQTQYEVINGNGRDGHEKQDE